MTEDYKKNLIDYVTGLLNQEEPQEKDFNITNINGIEYTAETWQFAVDEFRQMAAAINGILENEKYDIFIMYGGYQIQSGENSKGFLIYVNRDGVPFKVVKTNYRGFIHLDFDNESNRVYGVIGDRATYFSSSTTDVYFAYFNNLFLVNIDNFSIIQTYAYKIHSSSLGIDKIVKDPSSSNYLMFGRLYIATRTPIVIELKINVGTTNELTKWDVDTSTNNYLLCGAFGWYNDGEPNFKLICLNVSSYKFHLIQKNGSNLTYTALNTSDSLNRPQTTYIHSQFIAINQNEIYFIYHESWTDTGSYRRSNLLKYNGNSIETIYQTNITELEKEDDTFKIRNLPMLNIVIDVDNTLYLIEYINNEDDDSMQLNLCNLKNNPNANKWEKIGTYLSIYASNIYNQRAILRRNYNILNIFSFSGYFKESLGSPTGAIDGNQINIQNLAPINGYIGEPYSGVDALVPKYSNLYSNGLLVFSRNLYNVTKQNNQTMSSVEVPNTYINDLDITQNDLISKTNIQMNSDVTNWTKNIYEVVDLNFLNTISIMDEDTNTPYLNSAIKLNNSITDGGDTNYQNTSCNKIRINYVDGTNAIQTILWNDIDDTHKKTEISLFIDKEMLSMDFISNDETTIYLTKEINELIIGKYYTITQKIKIE